MSKDISGSNRLAQEKSPYLLQHANNPVDWFPWGEEAFAKATSEDKPVFLSIGYATCHWCHVMAHESFEDEEVAELLNRSFVPIKVDREERPDIDTVYMKACHLVSGRGGWPLTVCLTPEKKPFFVATYIPKQARFPQNGLMDLLPKIATLWQDERPKVQQSAESIHQALTSTENDTSGPYPDESVLKRAADEFRQRFDQVHGGFGQPPKFPSPHNFLFLLRYYRRTRDPEILNMVTKSLRFMRSGGLFDHLGKGFHRYSTDKEWLLPHFEKMLYDQALLSLAYLETYETTNDQFFAETAREIFSYVLNDLRSPEGVFFSGEDADSEGVEGKFYLWTESEIREALTEEEAEIVLRAYGLKSEGNFLDEATRKLTGENILHRLGSSDEELAESMNLASAELRERLQAASEKLLAIRKSRVRPELDDKVLTDWNGLMIAGLAAGGRILDDAGYTRAAEQAADFLLTTMRTSQDQLLHRYKEGDAAIDGFLDDYAFLAWGLIELYRATAREDYLQSASKLVEVLLNHFWDHHRGGFFMTADDAERVLLRCREVFDGAIPSGNSAALNDLLALKAAHADGNYGRSAEAMLKGFSGLVTKHPSAFAAFLCGLDATLHGHLPESSGSGSV
jgi:uncharacterized protein YyaL (SSP411 family)